MAQTHLLTLAKTLAGSELAEAEKEKLFAVFSLMDPEELASALRLFSEDPSWVHKISKNIKDKEAAVAADDNTAWEKIVSKEEEELKRLEM